MPGKEIRQGAGGGERLTLPSLPLGLHTPPGPAPAPGVPGVPGSLGPRLEQVEQGWDWAGGRSPPRHLSAPAQPHPCAPSPHQAPTDGRTDGWTDRRSHGTAKRRTRALSHPRSPVGTPRSPCCHPAVTLPPPRCHPAATCCSRALLAPGVPMGIGDRDVTVWRCPPAVGPGAAPPGDKRAQHPEAGPCTGAESQCQVLVPSASGRSQSRVPVPITGSQCSVLVPAASTQCPVPAPSHWSQHSVTGPSTQS